MSDPEHRPEEAATFEEFVAARMSALVRTAYLLVGSHHEAEDLVQTSLMKVVPHWHRIEQSPEAYVRTVIAREAISRWRRRRWREQPTEQVPDLVPDVRDHDAALDLRDALQRLAPRQRAVIVLRYFDDLTEVQTAAQLGIAVGTVKSQTRAALTRLRADLPGLRLPDTNMVTDQRAAAAVPER